MLRNPGSAIYVVIPEGDAERYSAFLTTFFGLAMTVLRTLPVTDSTIPALFVFDEAGNIPIHGLKEMLGVGRGRKVGVVLAYQNLGQVYAIYGRDGGDAVLGSINTMIFLPGLDQRTTEFATARIGRTTVLQHTTVDGVGKTFDAERMAETKRDLIDATELRQLIRHKQAVAIIDTAPPIKFSYPPLIQAPPDKRSYAGYKGSPQIIDLKTSQRKRASLPRHVATSVDSSRAIEHHPSLEQVTNVPDASVSNDSALQTPSDAVNATPPHVPPTTNEIAGQPTQQSPQEVLFEM
jgi:hypothetical protein